MNLQVYESHFKISVVRFINKKYYPAKVSASKKLNYRLCLQHTFFLFWSMFQDIACTPCVDCILHRLQKIVKKGLCIDARNDIIYLECQIFPRVLYSHNSCLKAIPSPFNFALEQYHFFHLYRANYAWILF